MPVEIKNRIASVSKNDPIHEMLLDFIEDKISKQAEFIASIKGTAHLIQKQNKQCEQLKETLDKLLEENEKVREIQQKLFLNLKKGL